MRVAVIGPAGTRADITALIPAETEELVVGEDEAGNIAKEWADGRGMPRIVIKENTRLGMTREKCMEVIAEISDIVIAVWDGICGDTLRTADYARMIGKTVKVFNAETGSTVREERELKYAKGCSTVSNNYTYEANNKSGFWITY